MERSKQEIKTLYELMILASVKPEVNKVNCYKCDKCKHITKTIDIDSGVTPFFHECEKCKEQACSSFYRDTAPDQKPTQEWYRPTLEQCYEMSDGMLEHVLQGGLDVRDIQEVKCPIDKSIPVMEDSKAFGERTRRDIMEVVDKLRDIKKDESGNVLHCTTRTIGEQKPDVLPDKTPSKIREWTERIETLTRMQCHNIRLLDKDATLEQIINATLNDGDWFRGYGWKIMMLCEGADVGGETGSKDA